MHPHNGTAKTRFQAVRQSGEHRGPGCRASGGVHPRVHRDCGMGSDRAAFDFSDTWQLVINTGTTIVTFLMVFLIQNSQNRDPRRSTSSSTS